jgi:hypothetical protein
VDVLAAGEVLVDHLADVREGTVTQVVAECRQPHPCLVLEADAVGELAGDVAGADAVLEPRVPRPRVDQVGHGQLLHPAQPLERPAVDHPPLLGRQDDQPMDGVSDLAACHALLLRIAGRMTRWSQLAR